MHAQDRRKRRAHAFSVVELLVVIGMIGALSALSAGVIIRARQVSRSMTCANNLRQIATGLLTYYTEYNYTPLSAQTSLPALLADVISEPQVFVCPASPYPTGDSYTQYYVPRDPTMATGFLLGCPNHTIENSTVGAFGAGLTLKGKTAPVLWNSQPVAPGSQVTGGTLSFADGTTVTVNSGVNVIVLVSFDEGQGRIYSAIKIPTGSLGSIQVQAAHGTHFDVATPACTAGVRGTQFTVTTSNPSGQYQTNVAVTQGTVWVDQIGPTPSAMALPAGSSHTFTVTPETAPNTILVTGPSIGNNQATWTISNTGHRAFTINQLSLGWPGECNVQWIKLNGSTIFDCGLQFAGITVISSGWEGSSSQRSISPGQSASLTVHAQAVLPMGMLMPVGGGTYSLSLQ